MKKRIKTILLFALMGCLIIGYYVYLSNREVPADGTVNNSADANAKEVDELIARKISANYPETPIEVANLYLRITKAYYKSDLTDKQIENLGAQARLLFDDELLEHNPESVFYDELKKDIADYKADKRYITDYKVERNSEVDYKEFAGKYYSMVDTVVYLREGSKLIPVNMRFTLRKDNNGKWKILYWSCEDGSEETVKE